MANSSNTNIISNLINNMDIQEIQTLLNQDIAQNGVKNYQPKILTRGGLPTKKALAFNRRLIREDKTTVYLDTSKVYNADTGKIINKPVDQRYNDKRLKKSFTDKYNVIDNIVATKKPTNAFRYVAGLDDDPAWSVEAQGTIWSNDLIRKLVKDNNFTGNYRIVIQKNGSNIFDSQFNIGANVNSWWNENHLAFQVRSGVMIWNNDLNEDDVINIIFTKEKNLPKKYFSQTFLDGKLAHCILQPIIDWIKTTIENCKSKSTIATYKSKLNKITGKTVKDKRTKKTISLLEKYKKGVPQDELPTLCEDLQIGMDIDQPFSNKLLFEYRSMKKPLKVFKYINTRADHVEVCNGEFNEKSIFKNGDTEFVDTRNELIDLMKQLDEKEEFYIYKKDTYGICSIQTLERNVKIQSDYGSTIRDFEKDTGLKYCSIDALQFPELQSFINQGTHFNGTIDFIDTTDYKRKIPEDIKHIDMTKAYTQFKKCKYYDGFMLKITDFRKCDKMVDNGLYSIYDLDLSSCNEKFIKLNDVLDWFRDSNIYTYAELKALEKYGGKFKVNYGCWGIKEDFEFSDDMINKKEEIFYNDVEFKIPYYSKWCGMNCMIKDDKNFWIKGKEQYLQNIDTDAKIYYADNEARVSYKNSYQFNKKHITAQITAYQRLHMLDQLLNMNIDNVIRVCVDGIYYKDHDFKINDIFGDKTDKMTFKNDPCESYLSNLMYCEDMGSYSTNTEYRPHYKTEIFDGAGGDGKTYTNLFLEYGFVNVVYAPHSNKLESRMKKDYMKHFGKKLRVSNHSRLLNEPFSLGNDGSDAECYKYNVYIIDECSMLTENQKDYMINNIRGKIIFCGDLEAQLEPIEKEKQMTYKNIENVFKMSGKNYRFKSSEQLNACNYVRKCIKSGKCVSMKSLPFKNVDRDYVKNNYKKEDIILVSQHKYNDQWTELFKEIEKYRVKNNTRDFNNGDIIFDKVKKVVCELRHGYTVHSVQGETFKNNIYIDMRGVRDMKMFYTAISRAEYHTQIFLIK